MSQVRLLDLPADRMDGEVVAALFFQDERPLQGPAALLDWRLGDPLTRALVGGGSRGRAGEHLLVGNNGKLNSDWALFVGGGSWHGLGPETYRSLVDHVLQVCRNAGFRRIALCLAPLAGMRPADLEAMVNQSLQQLDFPGCECLLSLETI
ncbi:hypothetical protein JCM30471_06880 [Desulfuromonas carbonis]|uniref:M17 family peptidase N-terminal domain-containing protein n=1 Tax=Desulfuromonas sp. DDH964 TaxID=1823759 RepID=UPI00078D3F34|nr:M17 family peptidase N-terminal domain-containing protein [Desulfuromonas sp. DDH964]AMV72188.1 hypothetical protein DBW_1832 [Desulfuromonas sp. DDH964]